MFRKKAPKSEFLLMRQLPSPNSARGNAGETHLNYLDKILC